MIPGLDIFQEGQIVAMALIFLRVIAFVITWPIFGTSSVPAQLKVLLALLISVLLFPTVSFSNIDLIKMDEMLFFLSIRELMIGLILGFLMRMVFFAVSISGELISLSLGLSSAQVFNPAMGTTANVVDQFQSTLATIFFLAINGHHFFIQGIVESFTIAPVAAVSINTEVFSTFTTIVSNVFYIGIKLSAPILVAIFLANVAMGIMGKAVPQINVLVTSMPITFLIGMAVMILVTPLFIGEMHEISRVMGEHFFQVLKRI